jgi:tetratricopeptide (TPR) repeat protein
MRTKTSHASSSFKKPLVLILLSIFAGFATVNSLPGSRVDASYDQAPPAELLQGIGTLHHPITTTSSEAQKFFDQGLTLFYAFNFQEAARSFIRSCQLDPSAPMPYWGLALILGPSYNTGINNSSEREKSGFTAIQKAKKLAAASGVPDVERAYIDALAHRLTDDPKPDLKALESNYIQSMRELSHRYPDDPDAATLYAESMMDLRPYQLWTYDGKPAENTLEIVSVLEGVIKRWPNHPGANHFYVHALEASPEPARAMASAKRLETLVPAAGHLRHMPAHIYYRMGDYAGAVRVNLDAIAADRVSLRDRTIPNDSYVRAYAVHNFYFLVAAAGMAGDFPTALKSAEELEAQIRVMLPNWPDAESFLLTRMCVLLRFAHWDDLLAMPAPDASRPGLTYFWHFARGCSFSAKGQARQAQSERSAMDKTYEILPQSAIYGMFERWATLNALATHELDARIAMSDKVGATAIDLWRAAVSREDQADRNGYYREPPLWYYPMRESLGAALLRSGNAPEAEKVFREDLSRNPLNPRSLFGLWKALEAEKKTAEADKTRLLFEANWKGNPKQLRIEDF